MVIDYILLAILVLYCLFFFLPFQTACTIPDIEGYENSSRSVDLKDICSLLIESMHVQCVSHKRTND